MIRLYTTGGIDLIARYGIVLEDDSVYEATVMGEPCLYLHFYCSEELSLDNLHTYYDTELEEEELAAMDDATIAAKYYCLRRKPEIIKHNSDLYEYKVNLYPFGGQISDCALVDAYLDAEGTFALNFPVSDFPLTGTPKDHLDKVLASLNYRGWAIHYAQAFDGVVTRPITWAAGTCIDADERTINYSNASIYQALNMIAEEFDTEWYIEGTTIYLGIVRHNEDAPLELSYGQGNGLMSGVTRSSGDNVISKLWVTGTERNITKENYGAKRLHLFYPPARGYKLSNGQTMKIPEGGIITDGVYTDLDANWTGKQKGYYFVDKFGASLTAPADTMGVESFFSNDDIYPSATLTVSAVYYSYRGYYGARAGLIAAYPALADYTSDEWDKVQIDIAAAGNTVDYNDYKRDDADIKIVFQSGELSGKEFVVARYIHSNIGSRESKRFLLEKKSIDGYNMPVPPYVPNINDKFRVFDIDVPSEYYQTAEKDLLREACKSLYRSNIDKIAIDAQLDGVFATKNWDTIGGKILLNAKVSVEGHDLRISGIRTLLCRPHAPELTFASDYVRQRASTGAAVRRGQTSAANRVSETAKRTAQDAQYNNDRKSITTISTSTGNNYVSEGDEIVYDNITTTRARYLMVYVPRKVGQSFDYIRQSSTGTMTAQCVDDTQGITFTPVGGTASTTLSLSQGRHNFVWTGTTWLVTKVSNN